MLPPTRIHTPAGYAAAHALGYADTAQNLVLISEASPLPVASAAAAPDPLTGQSSATLLAGPYEAVAGRVVSVTLGGTWQGTVKLMRSIDGGATLVPLKVAGEAWAEYNKPGCEQAWFETEDGSCFFLDIQLASGSVDYRVSQ